MKIIKKIFKIIIIALAVFMGVSACNSKNNTAFAEEVSAIAEEESASNQAYNRYCAFTIPAKSELNFVSSNTNTKINGNALAYLRLNLSYGSNTTTYLNFNLIYPVILSFTINYNSPNYAKVVETANGFYFDDDLTIYLPINYVDGYKLNNYSTVYINASVLIYADTRNYTYEFNEDLKLSNNYIDNYNIGYNAGYGNGYQNGYNDKNIGLLKSAYNIDLYFYANDVAGVVATVNNATIHYTNGGLNFAPYSEEYESIINGYQPEYPENFIERCEILVQIDPVPLVEELTNDYQVQNFVLNYPTVIDNVLTPDVALEFEFSGEFIPFTVEKVKGFSQDYLTLSATELSAYVGRDITGIKITYYDRDIFSFYEPNALLSVDNVSATRNLIYGANTGYGNGYITGEEIGYENGYQDAVNGGYDNQGIFAGAVAFVRLFFELIGGFMERKIIGEITFGLIIIGIPATLMIVDLIISLIRKFLGKSGGTE